MKFEDALKLPDDELIAAVKQTYSPIGNQLRYPHPALGYLTRPERGRLIVELAKRLEEERDVVKIPPLLQ